MWPSPGARVLAVGCMRLSTALDRDEARATAVLHAALDAGATLLDTADVYAHDRRDTGHNERLIARALSSWSGDRHGILVATKGGLTRPDGRWVPDGRARHLAAACEASCRALDLVSLPLYQLHAVDPRTPLATSVRALDRLRRAGLVERIGLSNVTVGQIVEARRITEIDAVQVELSILQDAHLLSGVVEYCVAHGIRLLAHRPLGGPERRRRLDADPALREVAARHDATPSEVALAWLFDLAPQVVPLPGPSRVETAASIARAAAIALSDADRAVLDPLSPSVHRLRVTISGARRPTKAREGEVVLIMGLPGAGKSTVARSFVAQGYARLNRDEADGALKSLVPVLDRLVASGTSRIVLDNTYVSRQSRRPVLDVAAAHGMPVRGIWLATPIEDAQVNAVRRLISRYGRLLDVEEMRRVARHDPAVFGPLVQFRYQRTLEPPDPSEGFSRVDVWPFVREPDPERSGRAVLLWCDGVLWASRSGHRAPRGADDVELVAGRADVLRRYHDDGWRLLGLSWLPEIGEGALTREEADASVARLQSLLSAPIEVAYCPHQAGPPECWCRKPLPGLGVLLMDRYRLDPAACLYVGQGAQDPGIARRLGVTFRRASAFFDSPAGRR